MMGQPSHHYQPIIISHTNTVDAQIDNQNTEVCDTYNTSSYSSTHIEGGVAANATSTAS